MALLRVCCRFLTDRLRGNSGAPRVFIMINPVQSRLRTVTRISRTVHTHEFHIRAGWARLVSLLPRSHRCTFCEPHSYPIVHHALTTFMPRTTAGRNHFRGDERRLRQASGVPVGHTARGDVRSPDHLCDRVLVAADFSDLGWSRSGRDGGAI